MTRDPQEGASFPRRDPVGPAVQPLTEPQVDLVADVVAADAADVDTSGVRRGTLDLLADQGLLGSPLPTSAQRELAELLAGSDASTWFCWAQHQTPLRILESAGERAAADLRDGLLPGLRSGRLLAAVAFAHVRRPGPPNPVARRIADGWLLEGTLDWVTSWDIADVVMVMARSEEGLVCGYLPAGRTGESTPGLTAGDPLRLVAMAGTHTRPVTLDAVVLTEERVGAVLDEAHWRARDRETTADASPSAFGLVRGAVAELDEVAGRRADPALADLAALLAAECREVRAAAYAAADEGAPVSQRLAYRARSLDLVTRATTAVVVARAGSAMLAGSSAERRVREGLFLQVQAQTEATRAASVALLIDRGAL